MHDAMEGATPVTPPSSTTTSSLASRRWLGEGPVYVIREKALAEWFRLQDQPIFGKEGIWAVYGDPQRATELRAMWDAVPPAQRHTILTALHELHNAERRATYRPDWVTAVIPLHAIRQEEVRPENDDDESGDIGPVRYPSLPATDEERLLTLLCGTGAGRLPTDQPCLRPDGQYGVSYDTEPAAVITQQADAVVAVARRALLCRTAKGPHGCAGTPDRQCQSKRHNQTCPLLMVMQQFEGLDIWPGEAEDVVVARLEEVWPPALLQAVGQERVAARHQRGRKPHHEAEQEAA